VVLTLPYTMSQMGLAYGVPAIVLYNVLGAWSVYLLVWLYLEFKARADLLQVKVRPERHILQVLIKCLPFAEYDLIIAAHWNTKANIRVLNYSLWHSN